MVRMSLAWSMCGRFPAVATTRSSAGRDGAVGAGRGVGYVWIRELGGRRRPVAGSKHVALRNDSFRAYADYMETTAFLEGVEDLLMLARASRRP